MGVYWYEDFPIRSNFAQIVFPDMLSILATIGTESKLLLSDRFDSLLYYYIVWNNISIFRKLKERYYDYFKNNIILKLTFKTI